jgi:DNA-binding MarR family transcriptional regulator
MLLTLMEKDTVDDILGQWSEERPELDTAALGIAIRVMTLFRSFSRDAAKALYPLGLELFEYDVLSALRRQGRPFSLTATALAKETDLSSGAMTNRIDKLEERGLVRRAADSSDRRSIVVALTDAGLQAIDEAIQHRLDSASAGLTSLSNKEQQRLANLLRKVVLNTEPVSR